MSDDNTRRYTLEEIRAMRARGEDRTDWARVDALTEDELEAAIADDPDWRGLDPDWWKQASMVHLGTKKQLTLRIDEDIVTWFRAQGRGYQTRMNAALRAYMDAMERGDEKARRP